MLHMEVRPAAVAGLFYADNAAALRDDIQDLLAAVSPATILPRPPKALIVPHAGYIYSGPVAASAYAQLRPLRDSIRRVILLGPVHRVPVRGLALPDVKAFSTPLGTVLLDREWVDRLRPLRQVTISAAAHAMEHSIEVQLPFLQSVLNDFRLVPLAVGDATTEQVAEVIDTAWGGAETLIVVSSDLSHYLPYEHARRVDTATCDAILHLHGELSHEQACGGTPINGLMQVARQRQLTPHLLDLRNSGDTAGDRARVVGYAAMGFTEGNGHGR